MRYEVVLVTYRSRQLAQNFLAEQASRVPIAIVDNGKGIDGIGEVAQQRPLTRYMFGLGEGYAKAANLGARTSSADVVVFVNPDCDAKTEQIEALVDDLEASPPMTAVAATSLTPEGIVELGVAGWDPTPLRSLIHAFGLHALWPNSGLHARPEPGQRMERELGWLAGTCLAMRRADFLRIGAFDERFFLYNEDVSLGRRIREAGGTLKLRTDILVHHAGGGSGDSSDRMFRMQGASMMQYVTYHHGWLGVTFIRLALTVGALLRMVRFALKRRSDLAACQWAYLVGLWRGSDLASSAAAATLAAGGLTEKAVAGAGTVSPR